MVQLKQVSIRLKSIKNIQKITKTMKMVSASKFTRAERELNAARLFGYGPRKFYETAHLGMGSGYSADKKSEKKKPPSFAVQRDNKPRWKKLFIVMSSDRGLCGGIHTGLARWVNEYQDIEEDHKINKIVCVGDKSRNMLSRSHTRSMVLSVKDVGRLSPQFVDAGALIAAIYKSGYAFDIGVLFYNKYISAASFQISSIPIFSSEKIESAPNMSLFDDLDSQQLQCYVEFMLACVVFYAFKQGAASEQSARMCAMENATKNASDMIKNLTLLYNRTRQAVITRELIEVISGAAALK